MPVQGNKTTVVMTPVWFFYMTITCVTPSFLGIYITSAMALWKAHNWFYCLFTLVVKNT